MTTNAVARRADQAEGSIKDLVRQNWDAVKDSLPDTMEPKRFARLVFNSVRKTPKLAETSGVSLIGSLLAASTLGLEVDTPLGEAYLVPYGNEAQLIVGYQGIVKLYRQHPMAGTLASYWIGANDHLDYSYGTDKHLTHIPKMGDRGEPIAVWASYTLKDGTSDFVVLSMDEVRDLRGKVKKGDIADPQHWMARKTALKQVLKLAPKSTSLAAALVVDEAPIAQAAHMAGLDAVTHVVQMDAPNLSTVAGEIEAAPEHVDEATGEIVEPTPGPGPGPDQIRPATRAQITKALGALGVPADQVDAWLPVLGVPRTLAELTQDEAVELLGMVRGLDRDKLAALAREMQC